jgi:cytochrome c
VGALDVNDGKVLSGAFDTRAILWDGESATALRVLRFHSSNVEAVAFLPEGRLATAGRDGRVAIWAPSGTEPRHSTNEHQAPVSSLALSPDGERLFASGWDGQLQAITIDDGRNATVRAHGDRIAGMDILPDGRIISVGADLRFNMWSPDFELLASASLPAPPNAVAVTEAGVAVAFADGALRLYSPQGQMQSEHFVSDRPLVAIAAEGDVVATAAVGGSVWVLEGAGLEERYSIEAGQGQAGLVGVGVEVRILAGLDRDVMPEGVSPVDQVLVSPLGQVSGLPCPCLSGWMPERPTGFDLTDGAG